MPRELPVDSIGLTPVWLSAALAPRFPGVRVDAVEVLDATERTINPLGPFQRSGESSDLLLR